MSNNDNSIPLQTSPKLLNVTNKIYTPSPCRRVGLKRMSNSIPLHNISKKTKIFDENVMNINTQSKDKFISDLNCTQNKIQKSKIEKQREIEELKSELKNSKQHDLNQILGLTNKWLRVCQEGLMSLLNQLNRNEIATVHSMEDLIKNLNIDPDLINFNSINQDFY